MRLDKHRSIKHRKLETTTIYTKVATKTIRDVTSPLDLLVRRMTGAGYAPVPMPAPDWRSRISSALMGRPIAANMPDT